MGNGDNKINWENVNRPDLVSTPKSKITPDNLINWEGSSELRAAEYTGQDRQTSSRYDIGTPYSQATSPQGFEQRRHEQQSGVNQFGSMLNQAVVGSFVGGAIEGVGYLFDLGDIYDSLKGADVEVGNFLSEAGKSLNEATREATPIYTDPFKEGQFSPEDWSWWMSNAPSIASSLALMIPSGILTKGIGGLAKSAGIASKLGKTGRVTAKGITQAVISRQMESMMEASGVQEETYQTLISQGIDEITAKKEAGKAASNTYKANWAMLAQDIVQYTTLIKPFGKATSDLTMKSAKRLGKDMAPVILNKYAAVGKDMVGEAAEEGYQYIAGERAREMAEVRTGLRSKRSLGDAASDYMGEGDFWTSAFFGAIGAGFMQTAGKGLNAAKERIRGLETEDQKRLKDIDSWGQSIRGLGELNTVGEAIGSEKFNAKNRQLAEFGSRLSSNGNLNWFLEASDNFSNMSEEEQESLGFTPEELQMANNKFSNLKSDLKKIGEIYEDVVNNKDVPKVAVDLVVQEEFLAGKLLEDYNIADGEYSSNIGNVVGLASVNIPPKSRDLIVKEKIELNNLIKVRSDLKKESGTPIEIIEEYDSRISELREEIKEDKKNLSGFEESKYKKFNARSSDFRKASGSYRTKEFLAAEHKRSLSEIEYYSNPENAEEINKKLIVADIENAVKAAEEAGTPEDVDAAVNQAEQAEAPAGVVDEGAEEQASPVKGSFREAIDKATKNKAKKQEEESNQELESQGKDSYASLIDAIENKYSKKPHLRSHLLREDIHKVLDYISEKNIKANYTEAEIKEIHGVLMTLASNKREMTEENFKQSLNALYRSERPAYLKLREGIFGVLNQSAKNKTLKKAANNKENLIEDPNNNSVNRSDIEIHMIKSKDGETKYKVKDNSKGENFAAVNKLGETTSKELGIDQEALNDGEVKVGDVVKFRISKKKESDPKSAQNKFKNDPYTRSIEMVVEKDGKTIVIGLVRTDQKILRDILDSEFKTNSKNSKDLVYANITSEVAGAFYNFTRSDSYGTPNQKIQKEDQGIINVDGTDVDLSKIGGWTGDYIDSNGKTFHLSGKTNMPIEVNDQFPNRNPEVTNNGGLIIPVPHPLIKGKLLYLRAFSKSLSQYRKSDAANSEERYQEIINTLVSLFKEYGDNRSKETWSKIKSLIVRDFSLKGDKLILKPRSEKGTTYEIPISDIGSSQELIDWLDDSSINIDKNKLNRTSGPNNIGYGTFVMPYNQMVGDFISITTEDNNYIEGVQMMVKSITSKPKVKNTKKVSEGVALDNTVPTKKEADPGKKVVTDEKKELIGNIFKKNSKKPSKEKPAPIEKEPTKKKKPNFKKVGDPKVDNSSALINKANKSKNKPKYRKVQDISTPKWNKEEEIKWFKANFPGVDLSVLDNLGEVIANGKEYWGVFQNAAIYVAENAATGTLYHEAFHAMFNLFTTETQREALLKEAADKYGLKESNFKNSNDYIVALEEAMADDFMEYVIIESAPKSKWNQLTDFFKKLNQMIKSLYKNPVYDINEFFFRGNKGFYKTAKVNSGSFGTNVTRYRPKEWTYKQEKDAVEAINGHLITNVIESYRENNEEYVDLSNAQVINEIGLDNLYLNVLDDLYNLTESGEITEEETDNIYELVNNLYDYDTGEFKELRTSLIRGLDYNNNIKVSLNEKNEAVKVSEVEEFNAEDLNQDDLKEAEETAKDKKENWQDSAQERSTKDNALTEVKHFIRYMSSGYKNMFGLPSLVDYNETYDTLLRNLAGTTDVSDMVDFLKADLELNPEYQQILDEFEINPDFKTKFFNAFNKSHTKYNIVSYINGNFVVYQSNRKGLTNRIISEWTEDIFNNKNVITTNSKGERTVNKNVIEIVKTIRENVDDVIKNWSEENTVSDYQALSDSISKLGIKIEPKVLNYIGSTKGNLTYFFNKGEGNFNYILSKFEDLKNPFDAEGGLDVGESKAIKKAAAMVSKASPELYESSFRNIDGKTVYSHLEQSFLSKLTSRLQNKKRLSAELEKYSNEPLLFSVDENGDKYFHNRILKDLQDGKEIFDVMITDGLTDDLGNRTPYRSLDKVGLSIYSIHNYFNNGNKTEAWYRGPVLSDAPNGLTFKHKKDSKEDVLYSLATLAGTEYDRIKSIGKELKSLKESDRIANYHIPENASVDSGYHIVQDMRGKKADVSSIKGRKSVTKHLEEKISKRATAYYQSLKDSKVVVIKEDGKLDKDNSRLSEKLMETLETDADVNSFIELFYFNDFLSRAEFNLITTGDTAFYKSSKKGNNKTVDFVKRAKEIYSPKSILNTEGSYTDPKTGETIDVGYHYRTAYLSDAEIASPSHDAMIEAINGLVKDDIISEQKGREIIASYGLRKDGKGKVNQTDAQAYVTLPFYRRTMIGMGKWTNKHQEAYKRLEEGLGTGKDTALMMQPLKPFAYGLINSDKINRLMPVQNKNSEFLLLPQMVKGNDQLTNLLAFMNGAKIDSVNFNSAVKAGLSKVIDSDLFKSKETLDKFITEEYAPDSMNWKHVLNMEDRGIQQEVPEHFVDSDNLFGTQIRKLIMSDLFSDTKYLGMTPKKLRSLYEDVLIADLIESYNELEDKIVKSKNEDGSPREINYKYVYGLLLDEARKRGKGEEFEKAIQYDGARDRLVLPLFNPITARSAQNLITSIFKTRITKQKIKGGSFVQLSSFGLSDQLKLVFNKDGGLNHAEVMLPAWSRSFFDDFIGVDGEIDFKAIQKSSPEILDMIGYRIPTEDKYSMLPLRVIGFLPYNSGGAIMLPADITTISGSDFDVDKMYVMMKSFKKESFDRKDFLNDIKEFAKNNKDFEGVDLSKDNVNIVLDQITEGRQVLNEEDEAIFDFYTENKAKYPDTKYVVDEYDKTKPALEQTGDLNERKNKRNNLKIDIMLSVLRNPHTLESILSGGTFKPLQDIAEITQLQTGKVDRNLDPTSLSSMDSMHIDNMAGQSMVGIAANENAFHAIAQNTSLRLKKKVKFDGELLDSLHEKTAKIYVAIPLKENGDIDYGNFPPKVLKGEDAVNKISKNKAYYLAAIVDNAKDPVASYINYNDYTSGIVGLLSQTGLDPATITWFLKQPVINDIVERFMASGKDWAAESTIIEEYKEKYGITKDITEAPNLNTLDLYDNLSKGIEDKSQEDVFKAFLLYKELADSWTSLVLSSRSDTKGFGPTLAESEIILQSVEKVLKPEFPISGVSDLFNIDSKKTKFVAGFTEYGIKKPLAIASKMFPYSEGLYSGIKSFISENLKNRELSAKERNLINDQITAYMLSKYDLFSPNERNYFLNEFPKEFFDFKEKNAIFADNYFIRRLAYKSKNTDTRTPIERIEFENTGSLTNGQKNDIQQSWLDLYSKEEYRDMAEKLIKYTYFTSGMTFAPNGFSHLASVDFLNDNGVKDSKDQSIATFLNDVLDYGNSLDELEVIEFADQFYKNNYKNKSFVPRVNDKNIRKALLNENKGLIGFTVDSTVKDKTLIVKKEGKKHIFAPYISYEKNKKIFLFKQIDSSSTDAKYILVNKLGFPNYIYEYQRGATGLESSSIEQNNVDSYELSDAINLDKDVKMDNKATSFKAPETNNVKDIKRGSMVIKNALINPGDKYSVEFEYDGKMHSVAKTKDGRFMNLNTNKEISKSSNLVKLFETAIDIIQKTTCK